MGRAQHRNSVSVVPAGKVPSLKPHHSVSLCDSDTSQGGLVTPKIFEENCIEGLGWLPLAEPTAECKLLRAGPQEVGRVRLV